MIVLDHPALPDGLRDQQPGPHRRRDRLLLPALHAVPDDEPDPGDSARAALADPAGGGRSWSSRPGPRCAPRPRSSASAFSCTASARRCPRSCVGRGRRADPHTGVEGADHARRHRTAAGAFHPLRQGAHDLGRGLAELPVHRAAARPGADAGRRAAGAGRGRAAGRERLRLRHAAREPAGRASRARQGRRPIGLHRPHGHQPGCAGRERQAPGAPRLRRRRHRAARRSEAGDPRRRERRGSRAASAHDIVTSDGTTLLGADDKAGVAEIMEAVERWREIPRSSTARSRSPSRRTRRSAAASTTSTWRDSAPASPTRWTARSWGRSRTRPSTPTRRPSASRATTSTPARRRTR